MLMAIDYTIKVTDIIMIIALILGPIAAVQIAECLRKRQETRERRVRIFKTLMATRTTNLYANHIEALNLVEVEFFNDRQVMDRWRLYRNHLDDAEFSTRDYAGWNTVRKNKINDMLYEMSVALGYKYDKSHIEKGVYYPAGYGEIENQQTEIRTLLLKILRGERQFPMKAEVWTNQPPSKSPEPPPSPTAKTDSAPFGS
jgi:hypothetical protein